MTYVTEKPHPLQGPQLDQGKEHGSFLQQFISPDDG
jgi:hypothetical protein